MRPPRDRPDSTFRVFGRTDEHYAEDDAAPSDADAGRVAEEEHASEADPFAVPSLAAPPRRDAPSADAPAGGNGTPRDEEHADPASEPAPAADAPTEPRPAWYRDAAVWAHLTPLAGSVLIVTGFGLIPPLLIENTIGRRDDFVRDQAREALGFQLALSIVNYAALLSATAPLVWPLALAFGIVLPIVAAVDAAHGRRHRYPLVPRWLDGPDA